MTEETAVEVQGYLETVGIQHNRRVVGVIERVHTHGEQALHRIAVLIDDGGAWENIHSVGEARQLAEAIAAGR